MVMGRCFRASSRNGRGRSRTTGDHHSHAGPHHGGPAAGSWRWRSTSACWRSPRRRRRTRPTWPRLTAVRTLNGNSTNSYNNDRGDDQRPDDPELQPHPRAARFNRRSCTLTYGSYDYNQTTQTFSANYPPTSGVPWTAVTATVTLEQPPGRVQRVLRLAVLAERHRHGPGGPPPARHRPGDGPVRLDALRHLPRVRLLHRRAHHQQPRHRWCRPLGIIRRQQRPAWSAQHQPDLSRRQLHRFTHEHHGGQFVVYA